MVDMLASAMLVNFKESKILPGIDFIDGIPLEQKTVAYYPILAKNESELDFLDENVIPSIENNSDPKIKWVILCFPHDPESPGLNP
jgi:hypothetical protein